MIRYAKPSDVDFIYYLGKENLPTSFTKKALKGFVEEKETIHIFVLEEEDLIGYIIIWESDYQAEIIDVVIKDGKRGQGHGKSLMEYVFDFLRNKNTKTLSLEVSTLNTKAINLYEQLGFKKIKTLKNYYKDSDGLLYIKHLQ